MKQITKDEHDKLTNKTPFLEMVKGLQVGQALVVKNEHWIFKSSVPIYVRSSLFGNGLKFEIKQLADKSGYSILRKE